MKRNYLFLLLFTCFFTCFSLRIRAQEAPKKVTEFSVSGTVTDENEKGLAGITVQVKGTKGGNASTITDAAGNYRITVTSPNAVLLFTYVGYQAKELPINNHMIVNTSLELSTKALSDVVVIGYGTQRRKAVTGAISSFDARKLDERPIERVDQALVGQMAGVTVKQTTGIPGKAFSIQIRGSGSISGGNEPLYVLDGFPLTPNSSNTANGSFSTGNPLDNINPNDIESIEVLKDAAAAAIYGSRASNGVVLITTKRGQIGRPKINVNTYGGYNQASKKLKMMNGDEWIANATEVINAQYVAKYGSIGATANDAPATRLAFNGGKFDANLILDPRWTTPGHPGLEYLDWQDIIERKGQQENYEVSASGGNDAVKYFLSGNYANQDGFIIDVGYRAYSLRANLEVNATKRLKFGINIAPTYSITQDPGVEGQNNIFHQALSSVPVQEDTMGLLPSTNLNGQYIYANSINSSYGKLIYDKGTTKRYRTIGTIYGEYQIIKGLNFRSTVNLDNTDNIATTYVPYVTVGTQGARTFTGSNNLLAATSGTYNSYRHQTFVTENTFTYNTVINKDHSLNILAGYAYNFDRFDKAQINSNTGYSNAVIQTLNAAAAVTGNTQSNQSVLISYFTRLQYSFRDKYFLMASWRDDGSSRFGINDQYAQFPSVAGKWIVTEENFMRGVPTLSDLKLRASYGTNGNYNLPNDYASLSTIGSYGYVFGTTQATVIGQAPNVLANPNLQWEKSQTYDFGLDFGILANRITGSFDYYNKLNTNLLLFVQVPEATGFQTYLTNVGSVRNIGQELEITSRNLVGKFQWNTSLNITHNTNKIVALAPGQNQIIVPNGNNVADQILRVGQPLNSIYVLKITGFLTAADLAKHVATYGSGEAEGDFKYQDLNGDGVITEADKQIVGHPNPDYTFGITNTFNYKGFDLSFLIQGTHGGSIYSEIGRALTRPGQGKSDNHPESFVHRWESPTNQGWGRFGKTYSTYNSPISAATDWLYSADYIRVRDITFGYNFKNIIHGNAIQGIRAYITLENFFGADKYTNGLNPEAANQPISSNAAYPEAGDYGGLPLAKSFVFGLNITF